MTRSFIEKHNLEVNPDGKTVLAIRQRLKDTHGYCPCVPERNDDTRCPCKKVREIGECCCELYTRKVVK